MLRRTLSKIIPKKFPIFPKSTGFNSQNHFLIHKSKPLQNATHFQLPTPFQQFHSQIFPDKTQENKLKLKHIFDSAKSLKEMLKAFFDLDAAFFDDENNEILGLAAAKIALQAHLDNQDPELVLTFGKKAAFIFTRYENDIRRNASYLSFIMLMNLYFAGCACVKLRRVEESLDYLSRASSLGSLLLEDGSFSERGDNVGGYKSFMSFIAVIEKELFDVKRANGMGDEAENVGHLRKCVDFQEKFVEEYDLDLANNCKVLTATYAGRSEFKEALHFGLKALKIYGENFGKDSVEVALMRMTLGIIYDGMKDFEKALEQHSLSMGIMKKAYPSSVSVDQEIKCAEYRIRLGRKEEAICALKSIVPHIEKYVELRGGDFLAMAERYSCGGKFDIFVKKDIWRCDEDSYACFAVMAFRDLSKIYELMEEHETAVSYLRRVLMMPEKLPLEQLSMDIERFFYLIDLTGKAEEEISYVEVVVLKMKESFGSKHLEVGKAYFYLGVALLKLCKPEKAAELLTNAKDIMDASLGPNHEVSIRVCEYLVATYDYMERFPLAINIQKMVIERLKGKTPIEQGKLGEAVKLLVELELLKEKGERTKPELLKEKEQRWKLKFQFSQRRD